MANLNQAQKQAIEYTAGPLMIVAGAGTGKTTVITKKIAYLIKQNLATPEQILALTFTDKAAAEMGERVDQLLPLNYVELQISTFHSFCQRLLEQYGLTIGLGNHFKLLTTIDAWLLVRQNFDRFKLEYYRPLANPNRHIHELIKHFTKCKDELISPEDYLAYAESKRLDSGDMNIEEHDRLSELAGAYHTYNQILLENNVLDFGDLIKYTIDLLQTRPGILKKLQERFKYILVDEFQDVNWAQYFLVKLLTGPENQLTIVGDDDQSIYAFRGASVSNILRFKDDFPQAKEIVLTDNYRSVPEVLDASYKLITGNNPDRLEVKLGIDKKLRAGRSENGQVAYMHYPTGDAEVAGVLEKITELRQNDPSLQWSDCAILVRANSHADPLVAACERQGIPYEFLASAGLYRQGIILDCLNFLKLLDNHHEASAIYRLLRLPFWKFKENDLQKITFSAKKKSISYYETIKRGREFGVSEDGLAILDRLVTLIHDGMKTAREEYPTVVLLGFLEKSGYFEHLRIQGNQGALRDITYLNQFLEQIEKYETSNPSSATVAGFLSHYQYLLEMGDEGSLTGTERQNDAVRIMTVHAAKGLEFKHVFVINLVEDRFPTRRRGEPIEIPTELIKENLPTGDAHIQEERRLCYVAMTRAKDGLYLSSAASYGGVREKKISRFLTELEYAAGTVAKKSDDIDLPSPISKTSPATAEYELPDTFSFSQIKSYQTCPYQYKLANVLKLPTRSNASLSFGTSLHSTLQHFYERIQELNRAEQVSLFALPQAPAPHTGIRVPSLDELLALYEHYWIGDWYGEKTQREKYYADGKKILQTFYKSQIDNWTIPVTLEGSFKIRVGEYLLRGRIDRIDQLPDGTLEIIDYKTGKPKEKLVGDDKEQLLIYQVAVKQLPQYQHIGTPSQLTFYYLNNNSKLSFLGSDKEIAALQDRLLETILKIRSGDFTPTPSQFTCRSCDFKEICEFRIL